jgi:hypothetical protein
MFNESNIKSAAASINATSIPVVFLSEREINNT